MTGLDGPVHGRVDGDGRLIAADAALAALHARAGGERDGPVAVPQLAALARLVRRLGVPVARAVFAADGDEDLDLWVRARPDDGGVALTIAGWTRHAPAPPLVSADRSVATFDRLRAEGAWTWACDAALRLTALSHEGAVALGLRVGAEPSGDALTHLLVLEDAGALPPPLLAALADGHNFDEQIVTVRAGGARYRLAGVPLLDPAGHVRGFRGAAFRIEALAGTPDPNVTGAFAQRLDAALRTPLQRIVATAEAIREQEDGPLRSDYGAYAGDIASAGRHLLGLVDDLVDLEAVERIDLDVERDTLDLADLARRAAGLLSVRADDKQMRIDRPDEDDNLPATGDFRRALQVLVNLVGNAVRFGPEGSTVTVRVESRGGGAAAVVIDEGRGIPPEDRERVFEKFERLGAREPGSGLGLYISRRLARAMGGDVTIEAGPGEAGPGEGKPAEGARVVFTLPR